METLELEQERIIFRALRPKTQQGVRVSPCQDKTGKLYTGQGESGYFEDLTPDDKKKLAYVISYDTVYLVEDGKVLKIKSDKTDASNWKWIQRHPYVVIDREKASSNRDAVFCVENLARDAEVRVSRDRKITMAKAKVYETSTTGLILAAKTLNHPKPESFTQEMITDWLIQQAERSPGLVIAALEPKNKAQNNAASLFNELKRRSVVVNYKGIFKFGDETGITLGHSEESAIEYLLNKDNLEMVKAMKAALTEETGE